MATNLPSTSSQRSLTKQMSLLFDTPLAKSIPNRTLGKNEMYIIVSIQQAIQYAIDRDEEIDSIDIDTALIAKARQKRARDVRRQCEDAVGTLSQNYFVQKILDYRDGKLKTVGSFAMYTSIAQNAEGIIHITPNPDYVNYYRNFIESSPDLQIPSSFYMHSASQFSYNLANWLIASIFEIRQTTHEFKLNYDVKTSEEDLRKVVPPIVKNMSKANYRSRVVISAIKDINKKGKH